jgi:hypothetical protein
MAVPEQMDWLPMLGGPKTKAFMPPNRAQTYQSSWQTKVFQMSRGLWKGWVEQMAVCAVVVGKTQYTGNTAEAQPAEDRAKDKITSAFLCPGVHFVTVLLINKGDGDIKGKGGEVGIAVVNDFALRRADHDAGEGKHFGSGRQGSEAKFARAHSKKRRLHRQHQWCEHGSRWRSHQRCRRRCRDAVGCRSRGVMAHCRLGAGLVASKAQISKQMEGASLSQLATQEVKGAPFETCPKASQPHGIRHCGQCLIPLGVDCVQ